MLGDMFMGLLFLLFLAFAGSAAADKDWVYTFGRNHERFTDAVGRPAARVFFTLCGLVAAGTVAYAYVTL